MKKTIISALVLMTLLLSFAACKEEKLTSAEPMNFLGEQTEEYITLGGYTGQTLTLGEGDSPDIAVWNLVISAAEVKKYPQKQVDYYFESLKREYLYLAEEYGIKYERVLEINGLSEESLLEKAKELTKRDLVLYAIAKEENLYLTDSEITANIRKYAEKIAADYNRSEEDVEENMRDVLLETMLYDKISEYLIANNNFEKFE